MKVAVYRNALRLRLSVLAAGTLLTNQTAQATTIGFSYSGTDLRGASYGISSGSGNFSFSDGLTSLTLPNLTAFSFSLTTSYAVFPPGGFFKSETFNYNLSTLTAFSATVNTSELLTALALATIPVNGISNTGFFPEFFTVQSLQQYGASVSTSQELFPPLIVQTGTVTQVTNVPEPSPVLGILLFGGCLGLIAFVTKLLE